MRCLTFMTATIIHNFLKYIYYVLTCKSFFFHNFNFAATNTALRTDIQSKVSTLASQLCRVITEITIAIRDRQAVFKTISCKTRLHVPVGIIVHYLMLLQVDLLFVPKKTWLGYLHMKCLVT